MGYDANGVWDGVGVYGPDGAAGSSTPGGIIDTANNGWSNTIQDLLKYGVSRAVDAEFLLPYQTQAKQNQLGQSANGGWFRAGQPSGLAGIASNPAVMIGGAVLLALVVYLAVKD